MARTLAEIQIRLIQARTGQPMLLQERQCFLERCKVEPHQLHSFNLPTAVPRSGLMDSMDVLMIGGAGEFSACDDAPWTGFLHELVQETVDQGRPLFGTCWGHQVLARALGGEVVHDPALAELGCFPVTVNERGRSDRLFAKLPESFLANMGHHDRVRALPARAEELAVSASQGMQAFRIAGKPAYGTQFHSELSRDRLRERLLTYRDHYQELGGDQEFRRLLDALVETTDVDGLMSAFLEEFVLSP